jgi:hypothetical protein
MRSNHSAVLVVVACLHSQAFALSGSPTVSIAPFFGEGSISEGGTSAYTTGYSAALSYQWAVGDGGLSLGPKLEFANAFVSTKNTDAGDRIIRQYDHRILALGLHAQYTLPETFGVIKTVFATTEVGRGMTGLTQDRTNDRLFRQDLYSNISGSYLAAETGVSIPLKQTFEVQAALVQSYYQLDQSDARGSYDSERLTAAGELSLSQGQYKAGDSGLASSASQQSLALKLGVTLKI